MYARNNKEPTSQNISRLPFLSQILFALLFLPHWLKVLNYHQQIEIRNLILRQYRSTDFKSLIPSQNKYGIGVLDSKQCAAAY
ncbi:hypothetical protein L211DRAFT_843121 [Terfezia boudieri ATCC MYA-4762]|uniref:Uncharacterized protein n=1 Tax=Terfezia boudieri ATCC MYA-4762 TaxID=1051890 RepID=A0A3N4L8Q2_9PEZI|nr:hypothetical protein L211DRAFT_843121 [Terfezia boudieri ATCC MYA-4762]